MDNILKEIAKEYSKLDSVYAVVHSGSRTSNQSDELSDYDIYVYTDKEIPLEFREELAKKYADDFDLNNQFFETGDEWTLKPEYGGAGLDFMFRCPNWIQDCIENTFNKHYASNGYTTCFLHNVKTSKILWEKTDSTGKGWFSNLQSKISGAYPKELKNNIINRNMMLLKDKKSASYLDQIKLALKRNDPVSVQHRVSAFLASYFDILFAANEIFHPGEKRLVKYVKNNCKLIPENFENDIKELLTAKDENKPEILERMAESLRKILP